MFMILAVPWAAAASDEPTGCDVAPTDAIVRGSQARPIVGVDGEEWRVLGTSADSSAWVVACRRGPAGTADTVERQWLVERVGGEPVAVSIGVRMDSSFEERFTGPVRVGRSRRFPASIPAWEVCGPWESGDTGDGARTKEGCRLVVSPVAARGVEPAGGQRVITFIAAGEHPFMEYLAWFDTRSTWSAVADGWRITETWTWRAPPGVPGGTGLPPVVEVRELRWDAAAVAFVVAVVGCENRGAVISMIQGGVSGCGVGVPAR